MLSKCANPVCSKTFLHLREGKLFRLQVPATGTIGEDNFDNNPKANGASRLHTEFFWLCDICSRKLKVICEPGIGAKTIPLNVVTGFPGQPAMESSNLASPAEAGGSASHRTASLDADRSRNSKPHKAAS